MSIPVAARRSARDPEALVTREVDYLVSRLLSEIKVPFGSVGSRVLNQLSDLKRILSADYMEVPGLPPKHLLKELARLVETEIKSYTQMWESMLPTSTGSVHDSPQLGKIFGHRELEVRAEPYTKGAGLALRGFFCRANMGEKSKFVIFLNTAHHKGAVAATFGHELGHYIYGDLVGEKSAMTAFMEGAFANHLAEEDELFADSLVALAAYSRERMKQIGTATIVKPGSSEDFFNMIKSAISWIGQGYNLDLTKGKLRVRYLTSITHFYKLRCALYRSAGL